MQEKYYVISCHVLWREICHYTSLSKHIYNVQFLKRGLHSTPDVLKIELQKAIDAVDGDYSAILIGYGLCSRGIEGITSKKSRLVFMKGHDCITFYLGSRNRYKNYFSDHPGTYWYTPGWIETSLQPGKERYEKTLNEYIEKYGEDNAEYLMEMEQGWFKEYENAAYVDLGIVDSKAYKDYTVECAQWLNWKYDELAGDPSLIKAFIEGDWDTDNFLVVEPGQKVIASNDDDVIGVE